MKLVKIFFFAVLSLVVLSPVQITAQSRKVENMPTYDYAKYHFGFILAANQMFFRLRPIEGYHFKQFDALQANEINADSAYIYSIESEPTTGFTVGIVGNLRLGDYFDLRFVPSLAFGERYLNYRFLRYQDGADTLVDVKKVVPSTFVEMPLHIKYKSQRLNNFRAYVLSGFNYRIDLASQAKRSKDQGEIQVKINRNDIYWEIGVGFDFYFEWFKFGTEAKMSYGILDMLKREDNIYTDGIDRLSSKIFQISLTFE
ncbi:MAG: PorT family protein [Bacteroidales bacterium]|nr:PorT family protein [Bacteroidales bacterium]